MKDIENITEKKKVERIAFWVLAIMCFICVCMLYVITMTNLLWRGDKVSPDGGYIEVPMKGDSLIYYITKDKPRYVEAIVEFTKRHTDLEVIGLEGDGWGEGGSDIGYFILCERVKK